MPATRLLHQPRENKHVQVLWLLDFLPASPLVPCLSWVPRTACTVRNSKTDVQQEAEPETLPGRIGSDLV